jgi:hypothetical protein
MGVALQPLLQHHQHLNHVAVVGGMIRTVALPEHVEKTGID